MKPPINPSELLAYQILAFSQRLYRGIEIVLDEGLSLSVRQWRVILFLAYAGSSSVQNIAEFWRYDKSQVSRAVSELKAKELVVTKRLKSDGRRSSITLTKKGYELYQQGLPLSINRQKKLTSILSPEELECFTGALEKLINQADNMLS